VVAAWWTVFTMQQMVLQLLQQMGDG